MTKIKEIFTSIQGEGLFVGCNQLFIRFCSCNLNCDYCDTDFDSNNAFEFSPDELMNYILSNYDLSLIHSVSLTGGEPLMSVEFLKEFLPLVSETKIYLETNATLYEQLSEIIDYVDIIACDIKLSSATGMGDTFSLHDKFFELATKKECYAKIVFDKNITDDEIIKSCNLAKKYNIELILQPRTISNDLSVSTEFMNSIFHKFLSNYSNVRLIPQVHKFINVP